ncbi:MAG: hypothetical protein SGILL_002403 [Bacillariaceae sp.]
MTASLLAKSARNAGFFLKLGQTIPEFKRRFFVLKAESNLYYYLSPNDVEPRGRIDLEHSTIKLHEELPDGRARFVVEWSDHVGSSDGDNRSTNNVSHPQHQQRILLEARSKEIGDEWIRCMEEERVSFLKQKVDTLQSETSFQKSTIQDLEKQLNTFEKMEEDRDGALEDARNWQSKFEKLEEALRLLTQQVRQPPVETAGELENEEMEQPSEDVSVASSREEEKKEDDADADEPQGKKDINKATTTSGSDAETADTLDVTESTPTKSNAEKPVSALLDEFLQHDNMNVEEMMYVPGNYFSSLSNACRQQKESLRLAYVEASTAVEDVVKANERVESVEKRMQKAEKQLLKLWEENCTIRNTLKQKKREKRVLVKEVKHLQGTVKNLQEDAEKQENLRLYSIKAAENDNNNMADTIIGSDEERLIDELEAHVASSIRLQERLLVGNENSIVPETAMDLNISMDESISTQPQLIYRLDKADGDSKRQKNAQIFRSTKPLEPSEKGNLLSLFDDEDSGSESSMDGEDSSTMKPVNILADLHSVAPSISSTRAEMGDNEIRYTDTSARSNRMLTSTASCESPDGTPNRPNPLLNLDSEDVESQGTSEHQRSPVAITKNGRATTRLECPLADVVDTNTRSKSPFNTEPNEELQVQHLTFYSKKIGIQFQKAPPAPVKPRGLLTEALTADLIGEPNGSRKSAAQLRSVASIASLANGSETNQGIDHCPLALPDDIVLVCGFEGFDDSGTNQRPKLGARLVAFDGVSVEVGKWTFDSIRKAIKMRGRPLTLSFRNDFLTTEQRAVLTKAVMDVDAKRPTPRVVSDHDRSAFASLSAHTTLSHETGVFANSFHNRHQVHRRGDSVDGRNQGWSNYEPPSSNSSLSSGYRETPVRRLSSTSVSTHQSHNNFRSFSDAGSSVVSASLAPLMANLLKGVSSSSSEHGRDSKQQRFEPDYLRREPKRLDQTPQHLDFQSNLL